MADEIKKQDVNGLKAMEAKQGSTTETDSSVTMVDILQAEQDLEEESAAVLGGSDEKYCTYAKGYIKRQALFSCLTCTNAATDPSKRAGVCLACSYHCHENHELVELYTKRNFRCDCGGKRMPNVTCTLDSIKLDEITENLYNQNFSGLYCFCRRPYPDPDDSCEDEMIQCIICEDWYHCRHLEATMPSSNVVSEMICGDCMKKNTFLKDYTDLCVVDAPHDSSNGIEKKSAPAEKTDETLTDEINQCVLEIIAVNKVRDAEPTDENEPPEKKIKTKEELKVSVGDESKQRKLDCRRPAKETQHTKGATFWPNLWRNSLCNCAQCLKLYSELHVEFLLDTEDTVQKYEEYGKSKVRESDFDRGMRALSSLDRVQQVDVITGYNKMKDKLKEFLHTFAVNQQIVTEEDINRFFQMMKREEPTPIGQPHFCR